jgi:hypothetical protein
MEKGKPVVYAFYTDANKACNWTLVSGNLPGNLTFSNGRLDGTPVTPGYYKVKLRLDNGREQVTRDYELLVRNANIAPTADTIYANVWQLNEAVLDSCWYTFGKSMYARTVEVINDGKTSGPGSVFYSLAAKARIPKVDYYGYGWKEKRKISMLAFHTGCLEEFGGWFTSLNVQYLDDSGKWVPVERTVISPPLPETDVVFFQPHFAEYVIRFEPVVTKGIRIIGDTKVSDHWHKFTKQVSGFTSITELSVYQ